MQHSIHCQSQPNVWSLDRSNGPTFICVTFPSKSLARSASSSDGSQKGIHRGPVRWPTGFRYSLYLLSSGECATRDCSTFGLGSKGAAPSAIYRSPGTARDFFRSSCSHWACFASQRDAQGAEVPRQSCAGPFTWPCSRQHAWLHRTAAYLLGLLCRHGPHSATFKQGEVLLPVPQDWDLAAQPPAGAQPNVPANLLCSDSNR